MSNDISLPEAKFEEAFDAYYSFLRKLVHGDGDLGPSQRVVTLNTITPFSVAKGKPRYNNFILRAYGDLVVRRSIPAPESPKTPPADVIDSANTGDAWSREYTNFMYPQLSQELKKYIQDPVILAKISAEQKVWDEYWEEYDTALNELDMNWRRYAKEADLDQAKDPVRYFQEKDDFYRPRRQKVQRLYNRQLSKLMEIEALEHDHLDPEGMLYKRLRDQLSPTMGVKLPIRPELENSTNDPSSSPGDFDDRPAMYPASGTNVFEVLLDEGNDGDENAQFQRGYSIGRNQVTKYSHDVDWAASGSARKFFFLKANLSISEKRHFEEQIAKIGRIDVGFRAVQEVFLVRGGWYSGAFLKSKVVQAWFDKRPEYRDKLAHLITSVIVCRGLTVKLNFTTDIHQNSWRELKMSGSGGLSVGGWNFGMSGHYNERTEWDIKDVTNNSVTFVDGPKVCRVLGLRVEDVLGAGKPIKAAKSHPELGVPPKLIEKYRDGLISYEEFMSEINP